MLPELTVHPDLADLLPSLTEAEREELADQIEREGRATDPIFVWQGTILDGHNRYEICQAKNLPYSVTQVELPDLEAAKEWVVARQLGRRNLAAPAYGSYRAKLLELRRDGQTAKEAVAEVASATKRAARTIYRDKRHLKHQRALAPDVRETLESGKVQAGRQAVQNLAELEPVEQRRTLASLDGDRLLAPQVKPAVPELKRLIAEAVKALGGFERHVDTLQQHFPNPQRREEIRRHAGFINQKLDLWESV